MYLPIAIREFPYTEPHKSLPLDSPNPVHDPCISPYNPSLPSPGVLVLSLGGFTELQESNNGLTRGYT